MHCFGCDLFGNQFVFYNEKVCLFDIESAKIEVLANNFENRLSPKIPFLIGGKYETNNLYILDFYKRLDVSASIYHQIKDLPDGTPVEIVSK
jgi:hypothetical protein